MFRIALTLVLLLGCGFAREASPGVTSAEPGEAGWKDLFDGKTLDGWTITQFGGQGDVFVNEGSIVLAMGEPMTGITWKGEFPKDSYEVTLEAMREVGNDFFCGLTFPVGDEFCSLILGGWGGGLVGLSSIDGHDASENETTKFMSFKRGQWYSVRVQVTDREIRAWLDGSRIVDVERDDHRFSVRSEVRLSRPFGIATWMTTARVRNIRVKSTVPSQ